MPALVAGIHVLTHRKSKDVDGRDKPGHDGIRDSPADFGKNAFDSNLNEILIPL